MLSKETAPADKMENVDFVNIYFELKYCFVVLVIRKGFALYISSANITLNLNTDRYAQKINENSKRLI